MVQGCQKLDSQVFNSQIQEYRYKLPTSKYSGSMSSLSKMAIFDLSREIYVFRQNNSIFDWSDTETYLHNTCMHHTFIEQHRSPTGISTLDECFENDLMGGYGLCQLPASQVQRSDCLFIQVIRPLSCVEIYQIISRYWLKLSLHRQDPRPSQTKPAYIHWHHQTCHRHHQTIPYNCYGHHGRCPCKNILSGVIFSRLNTKTAYIWLFRDIFECF